MAPAVAMRGITKRFPGVLANDAVDFEAAVGEVHALLGENGAGKSTLSNILTGLYQPDAGSIELWGEPTRFAAPARRARGRRLDGAPALPAGRAVHRGRERPARRREGPGRELHAAPARGRAGGRRARRALRPAGAARRAHLAALGRRAAARRDPQGAASQRAHPDPRRADGGADAAGGGGALPDAAHDGRRGAHRHLHLAQAARGDGGLRPRHRAARRPLARHAARRRRRRRRRSRR